MTIPVITTPAPGQTALAVPFDYLSGDYVKVIKRTEAEREAGADFDAVPLAEGADYTFSSAGEIQLTVGASGTDDYMVTRETPIDPIVLQKPGVFSSQIANLAVQQALDLIEEVQGRTDNLDAAAVRAPIGETLTPLPPKADRVGQVLLFDADGNPTVTDMGDNLDASLRTDLADATKGGKLVAAPGGGSLFTLIAATTPEQVGYTGSGNASTFLQAAIDLAVTLGYHAVSLRQDYLLDAQITIPFGFTLISLGGRIYNPAYAGASPAISVGSATITALPALSGNIAQGSTLATFATAHGLAAGDIWLPYNPTDYSYMRWDLGGQERPEYRAGEFCEVGAAETATRVRDTSPLYAAYTAGSVNNYKLTTGTFNVVGGLQVAVSPAAPTQNLIVMQLSQVVRSSLAGLSIMALGGSYAALHLQRCYKLNLMGYSIVQQGVGTTSGDVYGLLIANSQQINTVGHASSSRHAISHGGAAGPGCITNRSMTHRGSWSNDNTSVYAVDCHGNTEGIAFDGVIRGGVNLGGRGHSIKGTIYANSIGVCIYATQVAAFDFDFSNVRCLGNAVDPQASGLAVVSLGANGRFEADSMLAGTVNMDGLVIDAPAATRGIMVRRYNADVLVGAKHRVSLNRADIRINTGTGIPFYMDDQTGASKNWAELDLRVANLVGGALSVVGNVDLAWMPEQKGTATIAYTSGVNTLTIPVVFPQAFPVGYAPKVNARFRNSRAVGSEIVIGQEANVTATGFDFIVDTKSGSNFGVTINHTLDWDAA